jgi:hypothetical protein
MLCMCWLVYNWNLSPFPVEIYEIWNVQFLFEFFLSPFLIIRFSFQNHEVGLYIIDIVYRYLNVSFLIYIDQILFNTSLITWLLRL